MKTYISIFRGINVGGKNLIKMNALHDMYEGLGFRNVKTYIQSGNVVFQSAETNPEELEQVLTDEILNRFTFDAPVLVRELSELKYILAQNPFLNETSENISKLHITFLSKFPDKPLLKSVENISCFPDKYALNKRAIYLSCPNGYGKTRLNNNFFENKLKVRATTRNLKTLMELVKIGEFFEK